MYLFAGGNLVEKIFCKVVLLSHPTFSSYPDIVEKLGYTDGTYRNCCHLNEKVVIYVAPLAVLTTNRRKASQEAVSHITFEFHQVFGDVAFRQT